MVEDMADEENIGLQSIQTAIDAFTEKPLPQSTSSISYFQNTCKEVRKYLQVGAKKTFRIDLKDTYKRKECLSPVRSPQILITCAHSNDMDSQELPIDNEKHNHLFTESVFDQKLNHNHDYEDDISDDSDSPSDWYDILSKRCLSLDDPELSKCNSPYAGDIEEPLLLSWPTTRKKYKQGSNMNPLFTDRCDEPEIIL